MAPRIYKESIIIPVIGKDCDIVSIQFIGPDGFKKFLKDGKVAGGRFEIPGEGEPLLCEGFATGASIHEATGRPVVIAFNAGNLEKVAEPDMTIAGDNDQFTKKDGFPWNPGREKALTAAWERNCQLVIPTFSDIGSRPTDFNDLYLLSGLDAVRDQLSNAVYAHEYLLEELKTDLGAAYRPEHMAGLKALKERNKPAYMTLRPKLKKLKIGITELEQDLKQIRMDGNEAAPDHLTLAKEVKEESGPDNLIFSEGLIWKMGADSRGMENC